MLRPFVRGLKLVKLPNLKVIRLKRARIQLRKVPKIYSRLYCGGDGRGGGGKGRTFMSPTIQTSVKFWDFEMLYAVSLLVQFNKSPSNLAIVLFSLVSMDFPQLVHVKTWKKGAYSRLISYASKMFQDLWFKINTKQIF